MENNFPPPRDNPYLLGHEPAEARLLQAATSGRLPHAWLITGPRGIGKATLAFRFARFLLADGPAGAGGGGLFGDSNDGLALSPDDPIFRQVASGGHRDLLTVTRSTQPKTGKLRGEIVLDDVLPLRSFLHMTAAEGAWRVVVVDAADEMNPHAANALLKVLEEPPARAVLLLVCHAPGGLLPTIGSRCCRLALAPLSEAPLRDLIARYAPELSDPDADALGRLAEGSIGRALALADCGGLALYGELIELLGELPRLDVARVHAFGDRLARGADGRDFRTGTELLIWWLARVIRAGSQGRLPTEVVAGEGALIGRLLERRSLAHWLALWEKLARLFARAEGINLDRKQVVITAFLELEALAA